MKKGWIIRSIIGVLAILLVLAYFFLPLVHEERNFSNNASDKLLLGDGESISCPFVPEDPGIVSLSVKLTDLSMSREMTLTLRLTGADGKILSEGDFPLARATSTSPLKIPARVRSGNAYTLTVLARGNGTAALKGQKEEDGSFSLCIGYYLGTNEYNPVLLYFAAGLVLLALCPLGTGKHEHGKTDRASRLLALGTLAVILVTGTIIHISRPFEGDGEDWIGWDEQIHYEAARNMVWTDGRSAEKIAQTMITWDPGYLPIAAGMTAAQIFTEDTELQFRIGLATTLLVYAVLCALAVWHAPKYKLVFMGISLMPVMLFMTNTANYDIPVIGSVLLGTALLLKLLDRPVPADAGTCLPIVALMSFGTVAKPVYSLVLLLLLLIPKSRFSSNKQAWLFRAYVTAVMAWALLSLLMPGAYDNVRDGDTRFEGTDAAGQIAFILSNPGKALSILWEYLKAYFVGLWTTDISSWAYRGADRTVGRIWAIVLLLLCPLSTCGERKEKSGGLCLTAGKRGLFAGVASVCILALIITQYIVSNPVGGTTVQGMQPRYTLPLWILASLTMMLPEKLRRAVRPASPVLTGLLFAAFSAGSIGFALKMIG